MFVKDKKGQSTLEYVVIIVGIIIAVVLARQFFGKRVEKMVGEDAAGTVDKSTTKFQEQFEGY